MTDRKSHTRFRLVHNQRPLMTLKGHYCFKTNAINLSNAITHINYICCKIVKYQNVHPKAGTGLQVSDQHELGVGSCFGVITCIHCLQQIAACQQTNICILSCSLYAQLLRVYLTSLLHFLLVPEIFTYSHAQSKTSGSGNVMGLNFRLSCNSVCIYLLVVIDKRFDRTHLEDDVTAQ